MYRSLLLITLAINNRGFTVVIKRLYCKVTAPAQGVEATYRFTCAMGVEERQRINTSLLVWQHPLTNQRALLMQETSSYVILGE